MASPTKGAYLKWEISDLSQDVLQLSIPGGIILGGIDRNGVGYGSLTGGTSLFNPTIPSGIIDGVNVNFVLPTIPSGSVALFRNGQLQTVGVDYNISGVDITYLYPPSIGDYIVAFS